MGTCDMAKKRLAVGQKLRNLERRVDRGALFEGTCALEQTSQPRRHGVVGCYVGDCHCEISVYSCEAFLDDRTMIVVVVDCGFKQVGRDGC